MQNAILIVDDDPIQIELLSSFFTSQGNAEVFTAADGRQAGKIVQAKSSQLALIVCDLQMPGRDGIEFIDDLARRECRVPIILISGADTSIVRGGEMLAKARGLVLLGALRKPVDFGALRQMAAGPLAGSAKTSLVLSQ